MIIQTFVFNPFQENTLVISDETGEAAIVDPGCADPAERQQLNAYISSKGLQIKLLLNTHCHIDHVLGNDHVKEKYKTEIVMHRLDEPVLRAVKTYAGNYGFPLYREAEPDRFVKEGDIIQFGNTSLVVYFLPGHSPGHVGFYHADQKIMLSGDVLFAGSIGRTDLPGGNFDTLIQSIQQNLFKLPDNVMVYPGHGPTTTIGEEKISNPYCALSLR